MLVVSNSGGVHGLTTAHPGTPRDGHFAQRNAAGLATAPHVPFASTGEDLRLAAGLSPASTCFPWLCVMDSTDRLLSCLYAQPVAGKQSRCQKARHGLSPCDESCYINQLITGQFATSFSTQNFATALYTGGTVCHARTNIVAAPILR